MGCVDWNKCPQASFGECAGLVRVEADLTLPQSPTQVGAVSGSICREFADEAGLIEVARQAATLGSEAYSTDRVAAKARFEGQPRPTATQIHNKEGNWAYTVGPENLKTGAPSPEDRRRHSFVLGLTLTQKAIAEE